MRHSDRACFRVLRQRMLDAVWKLALALLLGCESAQPPADSPPQALSIDLVVTPEGLNYYTSGTDRTCDCNEEDGTFAAIDSCYEIDDITTCTCPPPAHCLGIALSGTGVDSTPDAFNRSPYYELPSPLPSDFAVELSGCGHSPMAITIDPFVPPAPVPTVETVDSNITARWQTDAPAASAYVAFYLVFHARMCHTTASELTYAVPGQPPVYYTSVGVTTFLPVLTYSSERREVRVWRGASKYVTP
jgi:hypothetical protein